VRTRKRFEAEVETDICKNFKKNQFIEQYFPTTSYHTVSKAGHWVHADNPSEFLSIINQIL
jgi:pimeloyl-ACP methyl ester carboxylesterase